MIDERGKEAKKITIYGMVINLILVIAKIIAGILGKSSALISDAIHSLSDFITDIIILVSFKITSKPADEDHNYGHGKVETISAVLVGIFLIIVSVSLMKSSGTNIYQFFFHNKKIIVPSSFVLYIVVISIILKEISFRLTLKVGKRINSEAVIANAWEHRSDAYASLAAFIGLLFAILLGDEFAVCDPIASLIVSLLIFKMGLQVIISSFKQLIDTSLTKEEVTKIAEAIQSIDTIFGYHNIKTRRIGYYVSIDVHIFVDKDLNVKASHDIATILEDKLKVVFGEATFISVHVEPYYPNYPNIE